MKIPLSIKKLSHINNIYNKRRQIASFIIKILLVFFVIGGLIACIITSFKDGYSHFSKRFLYFTAQSNLWIGLISLLVIISSFYNNQRIINAFYYARFYFIVCIIMTGFVYCLFLAPFADSSYRVWSFYNIIAHVITPSLAFIDFFIDNYPYRLSTKDAFLSLIPPLIYYSVTLILCFAKVDFGHGSIFPYFFLDVYSKVGFFGISFKYKPFFGTFYWIVFFTSIMFFIALLLIKIKNKKDRV